jgi:hypothetical protein
MAEKETPVETPEVTKIDLKAVREDLGLGVALDVGIHSALEEALNPKDTRDSSV